MADSAAEVQALDRLGCIGGAPGKGPAPWPLGTLVVPVYRAVIGYRNKRFDQGRGIIRFDRPVISIGNLSVGGTGKTPMVATVVRWLLDDGRKPVIAMRGYGSGKATAESDEAAAYRRMFPEVPIVAQPDRALGLIRQFSKEIDDEAKREDEGKGADGDRGWVSDCIVLDDGFQHRRIARDLDIVLIDAMHNPFKDRLLPAGWLREPVESLKRAGAVIITHAERVSAAEVRAIDDSIRLVRGDGAEGVARHEWEGLTVMENGIERHEAVEWLKGKRAVAVCAVGNPRAFVEQVRVATRGGGSPPLPREVVLRDHDPYEDPTIRRVFTAAMEGPWRAEVIVTTEKDWSKLRRVRPEMWPCAVARAQLQMVLERGGDELRQRVLATVAAGAPE